MTISKHEADHRFESKDRAFHGVIKNVETDQARVEIAVLEAIAIAFRYRHSITILRIMARNRGAPLGLRIVPGAGPGLEPPLAELHFELVILIGAVSGRRIKRQNVVGTRVRGASRDFAGNIIA